MHRQTTRQSAFTMVEIMIVVALIGLLAAIGLPSWHRARENSQLHGIANNLRLLEAAKQQWALENKQPTSASVLPDNLRAYMKDNRLPNPLVGETYVTTTVGDNVVAQTSVTLVGKTGPFTITSF